VRWSVISVVLAALSCGAFCRDKLCARTVIIGVKDETGQALTDFTATLTDPIGTSTVTCPAGPGCSPGSVEWQPNDRGELTVAIAAGTRSGSSTFTPVYMATTASDGCPGCPIAAVDLIVR
jgi:hypothetical protein